MGIRIDLKPEVEAELARQATARGIDIGDYAAGLLEEAARTRAVRQPLSHQELDQALIEISQFSHKIPSLPDEALSRESIYRDHD